MNFEILVALLQSIAESFNLPHEELIKRLLPKIKEIIASEQREGLSEDQIVANTMARLDTVQAKLLEDFVKGE